MIYDERPRWETGDQEERWNINKVASAKYGMGMGTNCCSHCGRYCVTKFLRREMEWKRDSGKVFRSGGCSDTDRRMTEEYNRGMRNGFYKVMTTDFDRLFKSTYKGMLPMCMVEKIRELYPSPGNIYHGHPWTEAELKIMNFPNNHLALMEVHPGEEQAKKRAAKKMKAEK